MALTATLPAGIIPISVTPSPACAFSFDGSTLNCSLGSLANGDATSVTIVLYAITTGTKTVTASVSATEADPSRRTTPRPRAARSAGSASPTCP